MNSLFPLLLVVEEI